MSDCLTVCRRTQVLFVDEVSYTFKGPHSSLSTPSHHALIPKETCQSVSLGLVLQFLHDETKVQISGLRSLSRLHRLIQSRVLSCHIAARSVVVAVRLNNVKHLDEVNLVSLVVTTYPTISTLLTSWHLTLVSILALRQIIFINKRQLTDSI